MAENPVSSLLCRLYELCSSKTNVLSRVSDGHRFEEETAEQVYYFAREVGLNPNPPRMTLNLPTRSGNVHQFDVSFGLGESLFVLECKDTREAAKDYLYYFNAKIMDYLDCSVDEGGLSIKGIFLSTVPVAESAWRYGLAYGIRIVDPESPPPEYMLTDLDDSALAFALTELMEKMFELVERPVNGRGLSASRVLEEYRFLCRRWKLG